MGALSTTELELQFIRELFFSSGPPKVEPEGQHLNMDRIRRRNRLIEAQFRDIEFETFKSILRTFIMVFFFGKEFFCLCRQTIAVKVLNKAL